MRRSRFRAQTTAAHVARIVAALTLVVALLAGVAPQGSLASFAPASGCSMSCCVGKPPHAAGDCASVSCHVKLPGRAASRDSHDGDGTHAGDQHAAASTHQTADDHTRDGHVSHAPQQASHNSHPVQEETHHAETHHAETLFAAHATETHHASHTPQTHASETTETNHVSHAATGTDATAGVTKTHASDAHGTKVDQPPGGNSRSRRSVAAAAHASVANPCPSDCGTAASGFGNNVRPRDTAALAQARRPRPPTRFAALRHFSNLPRTSSDRRRLATPRAPPAAP
ncbi:MAG: hypothetical protein QOG00_720 [Pyrinomonadaceae bacterium]|nr:hypothetical protein [Pyrinomonadaceae bacterium]